MALLHPESDLTLSLVAQGADILRQLHAHNGSVVVDDLLEKHLRLDSRRTTANFFAALDLLYAVGAIEREGYRLSIVASVQDSFSDDLFGGGNA